MLWACSSVSISLNCKLACNPRLSPLTAAWRGRALRMAAGETLPMQHPAHGLGSAPGPMRKPEAMDAALVYSYGRLSLVRTQWSAGFCASS